MAETLNQMVREFERVLAPTNVKDMTITQFLAECERLSGSRWAEYREHYSFESAKADGFSPAGAVKDCREWMDA